MKKLIAMMLCIVLVLSLVACGATEKDANTEPTTEAGETTAPTDGAEDSDGEENEVVEDEVVEDEVVEDEVVEDEVVEDEYVEEEFSTYFEYLTSNFDYIDPTADMQLVQSLYEGIPADTIPGYMMMVELSVEDPEAFQSYTFVPYVEGMTGVSCEAAMGQAHSVVLLNVPEGTDVAGLCEEIRTNANPRKWICVEAEAVDVTYAGNTILLVMADAVNTPTLIANFNAQMAG